MTRRRTRRQASPLRASDVRGNGEDYGKWYRCVFCGQICKLGRDKLGGPDEKRMGTTFTDVITPALGSLDSALYHSGNQVPSSEGNALGIVGGVGRAVVSMELGADGEALPIVHNLAATGGSGCPLCHSLNWRGDY